MKLIAVVGTLTLLFCSMVASSNAAVTGEIRDPEVLATVDGKAIPTASVDLLLKVLSRDNQDLDRSTLVNGIIENRLFAREAQRQMSDDEIWQHSRVGYPPRVTLEKQLVGLLHAAFKPQLEQTVQAMGGNLFSLYEQKPHIDADRFKALSTLSNQVAYQLSPEQIELARKTVVATYKLPSGKRGSFSYWDLYHRENVQGRAQLHQGNRDLLTQLAHTRLQQLFIQDWARHQSGLSKTEYQAISDFVTHKFVKLRYLQHMGLWADIHDENQALQAETKKVTQAEIRDYYETHKDEFRQTTSVTAYHITTASEVQAQKALEALKAGMADQAAIKRFSTADDRKAQNPGRIGPIARREGVDNWLNSIALMMPPGHWSRPLRSPGSGDVEPVWEIVKVVDRQEGYEPADSETVRYLASKKIAMDRIQARFKATKRKLFEDAAIKLNQTLLARPSQTAAASTGGQ
ncbi:peptidylprolyl isomerase [Marinobacteraceae bacterium S3BR75-40.1]